jgi:hypothetical protein
MSLFDNFRAATGLFAPSDDEGPTDFDAEPRNIDLVDADEITAPDVGDPDSAIAPPPNLPPDVPGDLP